MTQSTGGLEVQFSFATFQNFNPVGINFAAFSERAVDAIAEVSQPRELIFLRDAPLLLVHVLDKSILGQSVRIIPMVGLDRKPSTFVIGGVELENGLIKLQLTVRKCKSSNSQALLLQSMQYLR
jgi:hypothetical protein